MECSYSGEGEEEGGQLMRSFEGQPGFGVVDQNVVNELLCEAPVSHLGHHIHQDVGVTMATILHLSHNTNAQPQRCNSAGDLG